MKIAVACDRPEPNALVSARFGRTEWFLVYDTLADRFSTLRHRSSDADRGIEAARRLRQARVDAVVAGDYGDAATRVLRDARVSLFASGPVAAVTALADFREGRLIDR